MASDAILDKIFENISYMESELANFNPDPMENFASLLVTYSALRDDRELTFISALLSNFSRRLRRREDLREYDIKSLQEEWKKLVPRIGQSLAGIKESYDKSDQVLLIENARELFSCISYFEIHRVFRTGKAVTPSEVNIQSIGEDIERLKMGMVALAERIRESDSERSSQNDE